MIRSVIALFIFAVALGQAGTAAEPLLTKDEVKALIASARTPEDHLELARYYRQRAAKFLAETEPFERMMAWYRTDPLYASDKFKTATIDHSQYYIRTLREKAGKMDELALIHEELAKIAQPE